MTNYEWLVKQDLLGKFFEDFRDDGVSAEDMDSRYGHIPNSADRSYSEDVAAWLQEEHKEPKQYVELEELINLIYVALDTPLARRCESVIRANAHTKIIKEDD